jgi:hypothetical protein
MHILKYGDTGSRIVGKGQLQPSTSTIATFARANKSDGEMLTKDHEDLRRMEKVRSGMPIL